jgi:hypothetical protein
MTAVRFLVGVEIFLFATASRLVLGPTQPPVQWILQTISLRVKWPECKGDHLSPFSAKVKNVWGYLYLCSPIHFDRVVFGLTQVHLYLNLNVNTVKRNTHALLG